MLWFLGLGISGAKSIPQEASNVLKKADVVYLEQFTSPITKSELQKIKKMVNGKFKLAKRWMVEDGSEILKNAKKKNVVLASYGDPFIATTHIELRTRAIAEKIKTKSIHASSSVTSIVGECGLHFYKIGKMVTLVKELPNLLTAYNTIFENLLAGTHSVLLLEYDQDSDFFLKPSDAFSGLFSTEKEQKRKVMNPSSFAIVASRIGLNDQTITAGKISNLEKIDFGAAPHTIIIPSKFHFTESDALKVFAKCIDEPHDNSATKTSKQMIEKYVPNVRKDLKEIIPYYKNSKEFQTVLENAELYIKDAENFLEQGKDEVAILSIGYAEGLVDALRIAKGFEPKI